MTIIDEKYGKLFNEHGKSELSELEKFSAIVSTQLASLNNDPLMSDDDYQKFLCEAAKEHSEPVIYKYLGEQAVNNPELLAALADNTNLKDNLAELGDLLTYVASFTTNWRQVLTVDKIIFERKELDNSVRLSLAEQISQKFQKIILTLLTDTRKTPVQIMNEISEIVDEIKDADYANTLLSIINSPHFSRDFRRRFIEETNLQDLPTLVLKEGTIVQRAIQLHFDEAVSNLRDRISNPIDRAETVINTPSAGEIQDTSKKIGGPVALSSAESVPESKATVSKKLPGKKNISFAEQGKLEQVTEYEVQNPSPYFIANREWRVAKIEGNAHAARIVNQVSWPSLNQMQLDQLVLSAMQCAKAQFHESEKACDEINKILSHPKAEKHVQTEAFKKSLEHIGELKKNYSEIFKACGQHGSSVSLNNSQTEQQGQTKEQNPPATSWETVRDIAQKTIVANHTFVKKTESLTKMTPTMGDISKQVARNSWNFLKNNKMLFFGTALVATALVLLLLTPAAPLALGVMVGIAGSLAFIGKLADDELISKTDSLSNITGGLSDVKNKLSTISEQASSIQKNTGIFEKRIPSNANAEVSTGVKKNSR